MIVAFFGHSQLLGVQGLENKISEISENEIKDEQVDFYLGEYGTFDYIAKISCKRYRQIHQNAKLFFVTPYLDDSYLRNRELILNDYDEIIYPDIEKTPKKYAISARNKWIVKKADLVVAFVDFSWGGAVKALEYAHKTKTRYINLGTYKIEC